MSSTAGTRQPSSVADHERVEPAAEEDTEILFKLDRLNRGKIPGAAFVQGYLFLKRVG